MRRYLIALLLALGAALPVAAQQPAAPSPERLAAARTLLQQLDMQRMLDASVEAAVNTQTEGNPLIRPYAAVMRAFLNKYMSWQAIGEQMVALYAESFTVQEMAEMTAFYRTPTGMKAARLTPTLMQRGGEIGRAAVQDHLPELQEMMEEAEEAVGAEGKP